MSSVSAEGRVHHPVATVRKGAIPVVSWPFAVSSALAVVGAAAGGATFLVPGVLRGPAVMNGSARGTALVLAAIAVPVLLVSMLLAARGGVRAIATWLGAVTYMLYNSFLFLNGTPFNQLFLLYVGLFGLSFWSLVLVLRAIDVPRFAHDFTRAVPARPLAVFLATISSLNLIVWLARAVPAVLSGKTPAFLDGTGLLTNPTFVQDLSFWLPSTLVVAVWLWQRRPWGVVIAGALLVYGVIEGIGVATDQAFGYAADPTSTVVLLGAVPAFLVLAAIEAVATCFYMRGVKKA
jgi:hypothetical protein